MSLIPKSDRYAFILAVRREVGYINIHLGLARGDTVYFSPRKELGDDTHSSKASFLVGLREPLSGCDIAFGLLAS